MNIFYLGGEAIPGNTGGATHFMEVAAGLARNGHTVLACVPKMKQQQYADSLNAFTVIRTRMYIKSFTFPILAIKRMLSIIRFKPDIIMERFVTFGGLGAIFSRILNVPLILEINSPHTEELIWRYNLKNSMLIRLLRWWSKFQMRTAKTLIVTLPTVVPEPFRYKIHQVNWGANCELFDAARFSNEQKQALRTKLGIDPSRPVVVCLSTFKAWHGTSQIPYIAEHVVQQIPNAKFIMIGDGSERQSIEQQVSCRNLSDAFIFTGSVPYLDVPLYLAISDVGIAPYDRSAYPPLTEFGFYWSPLKIFECMACSLPVVTIDVEPLNEFVADGERGFVVKEGKYLIFSEKIVALLTNNKLRSTCGKNAASYVRKYFSWTQHITQLELLLSDSYRERTST